MSEHSLQFAIDRSLDLAVFLFLLLAIVMLTKARPRPILDNVLIWLMMATAVLPGRRVLSREWPQQDVLSSSWLQALTWAQFDVAALTVLIVLLLRRRR